jgi:hypothetical protein
MKVLRGTIFGGIAFFLLGFLVWGLALAGAMERLYDSTLNRPNDEIVWWAMIASNIVLALLLTLTLKWAGAKNAIDGLKIGAIFGGLYALSFDLGMYSMTTMIIGMEGIFLDLIAYLVVTPITGLIIVLTWGKKE